MTPESIWDRLPRLLCALSFLLILTLIYTLAYFAQPMADDFGRAMQPPTFAGAWAWISDYLQKQGGRWGSVSIFMLVLPRVDLVQSYPYILMLLYCLNFAGLAVFWRMLLGAGATRRTIIALTVTTFCLLWAGMTDPGQCIYWFTGHIENQANIFLSLMLLWGLTLPAKSSGRTVLRTASLAALAFFLPSTHELFGLMLAVVLVVGAAIASRVRHDNRRMWAIVALAGVVGIAIVALMPGNAARSTRLEAPREMMFVAQMVGRMYTKYFFPWLLDPKLLAATVIFMFNAPLARLRPAWVSWPGVPWRWLVPCLWLCLVLGGFIVPSWGLGVMAPGRTMSGVYTVFLLGWAASVFVWTRHASENTNAIPALKRFQGAAMVILALALLFTGNGRSGTYALFHEVPQWHRALIARDALAQEAAEQGVRDLTVPRQPRVPRIYFKLGVMRDNPADWHNVNIAGYYGLKSICNRRSRSAAGGD